jgi:hypothetical protein
VTLQLAEIRDLAYRFVPPEAADERLYSERGEFSWWPAHEIGHFLVATADECRQDGFGIDDAPKYDSTRWRYVMSREVAAMSISQRMLLRSGHTKVARSELVYTDEWVIEVGSHEQWCKRTTRRLLQANRARCLPATLAGMEALLTRKATEVGTKFYRTVEEAMSNPPLKVRVAPDDAKHVASRLAQDLLAVDLQRAQVAA